MFTLHFILLLGFSILHMDAAENADPEPVNLRNDSGNIHSHSEKSPPQSLTQPLGNEFNEDYDGEEFHDNRLRLMIERKKPLTLNETKLRIWRSNPNISDDTLVISYRNSFGIQSPEHREISRYEMTENISKGSKQENSNDYEIVTNIPMMNSTLGETFVASNNKIEAIAQADPEKLLNENNLSPEGERTKPGADSKHVKLDLTDITEEKVSNVTVVTGKFVASLSSSKNTSFPIQNEIINNGSITEESNTTHKPGSENTSNDTTGGDSEQKQGIKTSISAVTHDSRDKNVQEATRPISNSKNQTQNLENENFYEELEPDILSEENDTDYVTLNETAIDDTNTVFIVLPGSDTQKGDKSTETSVFPGKPYISEAISQNLLHLLMNLTALTAVNERNGKKILRELQEQKGQFQGLKKQSDKIYNYITRIMSDHPK